MSVSGVKSERRRLVSLAYGYLGSLAESEDVVQEALLRFEHADRTSIRNAEAWLTTVVTRISIDQLRSARHRREIYPGEWLPEPVFEAPDPEQDAITQSRLSVALLYLLEKLEPEQRVVFVLREIFEHSYGSIAGIVGKSEGACRQAMVRVRAALGRPAQVPPVSAKVASSLVARFIDAMAAGDEKELLGIIAQDAVMVADGGGKVPAILNPVHGADRITRFFLGVRSKHGGSLSLRVASVNSGPGILAFRTGSSSRSLPFAFSMTALRRSTQLTIPIRFTLSGPPVSTLEILFGRLFRSRHIRYRLGLLVSATRPVRATDLALSKQRREKIAMIAAYDATMAAIFDRAGIDVLLVGDSLGMTILGHRDTVGVTLDAMVHHAGAVSRGAARSLVVADMPFLSHRVTDARAIRAAGRLIQEGGAAAVKIEGGGRVARTAERLVDAGIPVMGHLGLTPQSVHQFGGFRQQARNGDDAQRLMEDAQALEQAGAFALVLECIPFDVARKVTATLRIPTIGIGAGPHCDGQVLVSYDMLGLFENPPPFVKQYANLREEIGRAAAAYRDDVRSGRFHA